MFLLFSSYLPSAIKPQRVCTYVAVTSHRAMSKILPILLTLLALSCKNTQISSTDDQLYQHVDSLITQVLNYRYHVRPTHSSHSIFPENPEPLILLNGESIKKEELRNFSIKKMQTIKAFQPSDTVLTLFGTLGKNGVIIIHGKKVDLWR